MTGIGTGGDLSINIPNLNVPAGGTDYQVFVTNGIPGCNGVLVDPVSFINGNPDVFLNVTGDTVCEGDAATVTLSNSQVGITYQLLQSGIPLNPAVTGIWYGRDLVLTIPAGHPQLATGTYDVEASGSGCGTVTLNQSPPYYGKCIAYPFINQPGNMFSGPCDLFLGSHGQYRKQ